LRNESEPTEKKKIQMAKIEIAMMRISVISASLFIYFPEFGELGITTRNFGMQ